jgi:hypothetical protein
MMLPPYVKETKVDLFNDVRSFMRHPEMQEFMKNLIVEQIQEFRKHHKKLSEQERVESAVYRLALLGLFQFLETNA